MTVATNGRKLQSADLKADARQILDTIFRLPGAGADHSSIAPLSTPQPALLPVVWRLGLNDQDSPVPRLRWPQRWRYRPQPLRIEPSCASLRRRAWTPWLE
jgi:hypothetical protein